jgi:hypothetical protein
MHGSGAGSAWGVNNIMHRYNSLSGCFFFFLRRLDDCIRVSEENTYQSCTTQIMISFEGMHARKEK